MSVLPWPDRFWAKVNKTDDCWLWTASGTTGGYGQIRVTGRLTLAHRVSYELAVGPIPDGLELDHLCRTTNCVRPDHLEPVTPQQNTLRSTSLTAVHARKTHCPRGHPYAGDNLLLFKGGRNRICRTCKNNRNRGLKRRRRAESSPTS